MTNGNVILTILLGLIAPAKTIPAMATEKSGGLGYLQGHSDVMQGILNDTSMQQLAKQIQSQPEFLGIANKVSEDEAAAAGVETANPQEMMQTLKKFKKSNDVQLLVDKVNEMTLANHNVSHFLHWCQKSDEHTLFMRYISKLRDDPSLKRVVHRLEREGPEAMNSLEEREIDKLCRAFMGQMSEKDGMLGREYVDARMERCILDGDASALKQNIREASKAGLLTEAVNTRDLRDRTFLHSASGYGELECVKVLLSNRADVNALDPEMNTPLHFAADRGHVDVCQKLLSAKCNMTLKNRENNMAIDLAKLNKHDKVVAMLEKEAQKLEKEAQKKTRSKLSASNPLGHNRAEYFLPEFLAVASFMVVLASLRTCQGLQKSAQHLQEPLM